jgi:hypothetical protein
MIEASQYPDETHYTGRGCPWLISCEIDGVTYSAASRSGAPYALARVLVAAGVLDQPMSVVSQGLKGDARYKSIHKMAGYTIGENATHPMHLTSWHPYGGRVRGDDGA